MGEEFKSLKERFIANGGTAEDFEAGRNAALERGKALKQKLKQDKEKDVKDLTDKGYTEGKARIMVEGDILKEAEARGMGNRHGR